MWLICSTADIGEFSENKICRYGAGGARGLLTQSYNPHYPVLQVCCLGDSLVRNLLKDRADSVALTKKRVKTDP